MSAVPERPASETCDRPWCIGHDVDGDHIPKRDHPTLHRCNERVHDGSLLCPSYLNHDGKGDLYCPNEAEHVDANAPSSAPRAPWRPLRGDGFDLGGCK